MATSTLGSGTLVLAGTTSGTTTVTATAVAGTTTLTLPAATDTLVGKATTDTLTNKTLTGAVMNGTVGATTPSTGAFTTLSATGASSFATSSGSVGVGTASPALPFHVYNASAALAYFESTSASGPYVIWRSSGTSIGDIGASLGISGSGAATDFMIASRSSPLLFGVGSAEKMRLDSSGNLLVGQTTRSTATVGFSVITVGGDQGQTSMTTSGTEVLNINRNTSDGDLVRFRQDNTVEGTISVSGTTVSYNGGHLSRWAQTTTAKDESLVKGTVLSNLDAMNIYTDAEGNPIANEQLNKVKVSDVEGDSNVAGVFVNWTYDEQHGADEINMAMTGDMIIRIAQGVTVARGDLLMSAGDGTAKPQSDDIVRSKTVAKVTSTYVTCTYADGSYCVPCVLMAC
jgi:hypothetical protein